MRDGGFLLLAKASDEKVLVQDPLQPRPALMTRAELEAVWTGDLVLMTRRASLVDLSRRTVAPTAKPAHFDSRSAAHADQQWLPSPPESSVDLVQHRCCERAITDRVVDRFRCGHQVGYRGVPDSRL
jgi:hypothetical protein